MKRATAKRSTLVILIVCFVVLCAYLFMVFYGAARKSAIRQLHDQQQIYAKQAARGIEDYFATWTGTLNSFAKIDPVASVDAEGKRYITLFYEAHHQQIRSITRVDERGRILYTVPHGNVIGSDISGQKHMQEILRNHRPVVSDVFKTVQGFDAVALHIPVFQGAAFKGTIAIVINFENLAKRYLEIIKIGRTGYAWVVSREGITLYSPVPGLTGKSVFDIGKDNGGITAMAQEMLQGREGTAVYTFNRIGAQTVAPVRKYAVYMPIHIANSLWSIVVASSEDEVTASLSSFRNRLIPVIGMILIGGVFFSVIGAKAWVIVAEEEKRNRIAGELRASEQRFAAFMLHLPAAAWIKNLEGRYIYANAEAERIFFRPLDALRGKTDFDIFPEETARQFEQNDRRVLSESGSLETTEVLRQADGMDHYSIVNKFAVPGPDGRPAYVAGVAFDITERKRAEKDLAESERRYRTLFEQAAVGVGEVDPVTGRFIHVNKRYCDIVGLSLDEMLKTDFQSITHPDDLEADLKNMKSLIAGEIEEFSMDKRFIKRDGGIVWVHLTVYPTWLPGEKPTRHIAIIEDITERKQAEEKLRESEGKFRGLTEQSMVGVYMIHEGRLNYVNPRFADIFGSTAEELTGERYEALVMPDDLEFIRGCVRKRLEGIEKFGHYTFRGVRKTGEIIHLEVHNAVTVYKGGPAIIGALTDITEHMRLEQALRDRESQLSMIYDEVYDIIFVMAVEPQDGFRFVSVNRRFLDATGLQEHRVVGRLVKEVVPEPSRGLVLEKYREAVRGGRSVQWEEVTSYPSGEKTGEVSVAPIFDSQGTCTQLIGTVHDVTERKQAEKALRAAHDELEHKVVERTRELSEANIRLKELDRLKSMFIASMSHELRTPLNSIIGFSSILRDEWIGSLNDEQKGNVSIILRSGKHLLALINDVIDVSKIEAGKIETRIEDFDIHSVMSEAVAAFKKDMDEKRLEMKLDAEHGTMHTDRRRLLQSVLNLVGNAVKFTEKGSVSVQARLSAECEADLSSELPTPNSELHGNYVVISVTDTGVGMKESDVKRLFNAFVRAESTMHIAGTGLGLYLTKKLVTEVLKGEITVASVPGRGSTFTMRIPVSI